MPVFVEGDLQITIDDALDARRFDGPGHGLSHCMKAVDFVIELSDRIIFIEFKDPDHPQAQYESRQEFLSDFTGRVLIEDLKQKFRDSFLYEWATGHADKPVHFAVLVGVSDLTEDVLISKTEELMRELPVSGAGSWVRQIAHSCAVFNIESWNRFLPRFQVRRLSAS